MPARKCSDENLERLALFMHLAADGFLGLPFRGMRQEKKKSKPVRALLLREDADVQLGRQCLPPSDRD